MRLMVNKRGELIVKNFVTQIDLFVYLFVYLSIFLSAILFIT